VKSIQEEHLRRLSNCKLAEFPSFMIPRTLSYLFPERPKGQGSLLVTSRVNTLWGFGGRNVRHSWVLYSIYENTQIKSNAVTCLSNPSSHEIVKSTQAEYLRRLSKCKLAELFIECKVCSPLPPFSRHPSHGQASWLWDPKQTIASRYLAPLSCLLSGPMNQRLEAKPWNWKSNFAVFEKWNPFDPTIKKIPNWAHRSMHVEF
jgi:hypothetical protein